MPNQLALAFPCLPICLAITIFSLILILRRINIGPSNHSATKIAINVLILQSHKSLAPSTNVPSNSCPDAVCPQSFFSMTSPVNKCHLLLPNNKIPQTGRILFDQYKCTQSQTPPSRSFIHLTFPEDTPLDTYLSTSIHDTPYLVAGAAVGAKTSALQL